MSITSSSGSRKSSRKRRSSGYHRHYQRRRRISEKNDGTHLAWKVVYPSCFLRRSLENASWHSVEDLCPASRRTRMSTDHLFSSFYIFLFIDFFCVVEFRVNFVTATRTVVWTVWYLEMSARRTVNPVVSTARYTPTPQLQSSDPLRPVPNISNLSSLPTTCHPIHHFKINGQKERGHIQGHPITNLE